jgi:hypothetical protein
MGDFCMSPMPNLQHFLPPGGDLAYYVNCTAAETNSDSATHSDSDPLSAVYSYSQSVGTSLGNIQYACPDDEYVQRAAALHATIAASIESLNSTSSCALVQPYLHSALETSLCTNAASGYVIVWACYCAVIVSVYFTCVVVCLLFEYFQPRYWVVQDRVKSAMGSSGYARRSPKSYMHVDGKGKRALLTACEVR